MIKMKPYYLGLDMGTTSVGWAVTDENYVIQRAKGKDLWGIREFEEANTSVARRTNRISRRRRQRQIARIGLLKLYFENEINKVDPFFYQRIENSKYWLEDKDEMVREKYGLFSDADITDKDYFEKYPTIFHLRAELLDEKAGPHDVRLVYLAILNMFKHRGHFLFAGSVGEKMSDLSEAYRIFNSVLSDQVELSFSDTSDLEEVGKILGSRKISRTKKSEELATLLAVDKKEKNKLAYIKLLCGLKADASLLFPDMEDQEKKLVICFNDFNFDEKEAEIVETIGESRYSVISAAHQIYNIGSLSSILRGKEYLSLARVEDYKKHKEDLQILKSIIRRSGTEEEYNLLFRVNTDDLCEEGSYSAYVNSCIAGGKRKRRSMKGRTQESFYKTVKKLMEQYAKKNPNDSDIQYVLNEISNENFMPKQLTASNGVIPNQLHAAELKKILSNASNYLPFLKEVDESGLSISERIAMLFSFQIPYYIGPTSEKSEKDGGNGWVVRKENGPVLPWNLSQKIDEVKTNERFIERLIRECSYLHGEKVLPKCSLMYERYCVLNEINNIKIKGEPISVELKQEIFVDLFEKGKKVSRKTLERYLANRGLLNDAVELSGVDIGINNSLSSYGKFLPIFGEHLKEDKYKAIAEDIIKLSTIYGDAKKILKDTLEKRYAEYLSAEQIKRIVGYKFKDWGRLSKSFLELPGCNKADGEIKSLLSMMWDTNFNMMELLNSEQYSYGESLEDRKTGALRSLSEFRYEDLDELYFSAPVKRMVWQTILIIHELEGILGMPPQRIFVEMTRKEDDVKQRTISRKQKFLDLYKSIKDDKTNWKEIIEEADSSGTMRSKKMYLYLTQQGRCMYTGEPINLDQLFNDNFYDIDHIYPRHFVKDDNIANNLVLVKKEKNAHKSDNYPLEHEIYESQKEFWKYLRNKDLISATKYDRLIGRSPLSDEQKADFIARQLVETAQGTKGVSELIKKLLPETTVVYSKASNVSDFRHEFDIPKSRIVNEFHHAHDAYLNIVVGNVYYTKFTQSPRNFLKNDVAKGVRYHLSKMFEYDVVRGESTAWIAGGKDKGAGTIAVVKKMLAKTSPLMTRMTFEAHGEIANATLYSAEKAGSAKEGYIPLKTSDGRLQFVAKYGGFTSVSGAYFFLVEHEKKGKKIRTIETMPIYLKEKAEKDEKFLLDYCKNTLGLVNPDIRLKKIKMQSLLRKDGYCVYISGRTGNRLRLRNAENAYFSEKQIHYIKKIEKANKTHCYDSVTREENEVLFYELLSKFSNGVFEKRPNSMVNNIQNSKEVFLGLQLEKQVSTILNMINLSAIGDCSADLSDINLASKSGVMLLNKDITDIEELKLICCSVTGLVRKEIDLLTL